MSGHSRTQRTRHGGSASTRDTHGSTGFSPQVSAPTVSQVRDGELIQAVDVGAKVVQTGHFDHLAFAPNVNNSPADPDNAEVIVDDQGLTVRNGKIFLEDVSGASVLGPAGFAGSWIDFLAGGLYNGSFAAGGDSIAENTIVGTASTVADYVASMDGRLPHWIISGYVSGSAYVLDDVGALGQRALVWEQDADYSVLQDFPVVPGQRYSVAVSRAVDFALGSTAQVAFEVGYQYRKGDHSAIGSETVTTLNYTGTTDVPYGIVPIVNAAEAPGDARWMRIRIRVYAVSAGDYFFKLAEVFSGQSSSWATFYHLHTGTPPLALVTKDVADSFTKFALGGDGAMYWGAGSSAADVALQRSAANELNLADGDTFSAQFLTGRGRVRLSSEVVSTIDANQNNYNPTGLATASRIRFTSLTASRTLTGLSAGTDGDLMFLTVNSTGPLVLAHESASSTAANRFRCPNSASVTIRTSGSVMLMYINSRWSVIQP